MADKSCENNNSGCEIVQDNGDFDFEILCEHFSNCFRDGEVDIIIYIAGFRELHKFFALVGSVFGFVASDVEVKSKILESLINGENSQHFQSIQKMINYEKKENLINKKDYVSGSRTLLRLHRALDFISKFLESMLVMEGNEKLTSKCQESYKSTLAQFHPWLIQKGALFAMHYLPTRDGLMEKACGKVEYDRVNEVVRNIVSAMQKVYTHTQELYTVNEILDLS